MAFCCSVNNVSARSSRTLEPPLIERGSFWSFVVVKEYVPPSLAGLRTIVVLTPPFDIVVVDCLFVVAIFYTTLHIFWISLFKYFFKKKSLKIYLPQIPQIPQIIIQIQKMN
jgi:hypothetical protein